MLISRLHKLRVDTYCTDYYSAYGAIIPENKLVQTKKETLMIKSNNGRQRDYFARFKRKTKAVSRSMEMVNLTLGLFATYHVNGNIDRLLTLIK